MHLGKRIKKILEERNITIVDFSKKVGVEREHLQRVLGKEEIALKLLKKICDALGYTVSEMLSENSIVNEQEAQYGTSLQDQLRLKDEIIRSKDERINDLKDRIRSLEAQLGKIEGYRRKAI